MAHKMVTHKLKLSSQVMVRKLIASVAVVAFLVMLVSSLRAGGWNLTQMNWDSGSFWILVRIGIVLFILKVIGVVLLKIMSTYEEIGSGQDKA